MTERYQFECSITIEGAMTAPKSEIVLTYVSWLLKFWTDKLNEISPQDTKGLKISIHPSPVTIYQSLKDKYEPENQS